MNKTFYYEANIRRIHQFPNTIFVIILRTIFRANLLTTIPGTLTS